MDDIADSFQFQLYAYLVFGNYEAAERVEVHVWKARYGQWSSVTFHRSQVDTIQQRILSAVEIHNTYHHALIEKVPGWPEREKCSICDVAAKCPMSDLTSREIAADPGAFVDLMAAKQAQLDRLNEVAAAWVDAHGEDIQSVHGVRFGRNRPKQTRKPTAELY